MADTALQNAERERDRLADEINRLAQRIDDLKRKMNITETFIQQWHVYAGTGSDEDDGAIALVGSQAPARTRSTIKNPSRDEVRRVVREILNVANMPMARKNLLEDVRRRGLELYGKDPEMVFSTMMWRMQDEFVRLPKWGYWFRGRPFEKAGYNPLTPYPADDEHSEMVNRDLSGTLPDTE